MYVTTTKYKVTYWYFYFEEKKKSSFNDQPNPLWFHVHSTATFWLAKHLTSDVKYYHKFVDERNPNLQETTPRFSRHGFRLPRNYIARRGLIRLKEKKINRIQRKLIFGNKVIVQRFINQSEYFRFSSKIDNIKFIRRKNAIKNDQYFFNTLYKTFITSTKNQPLPKYFKFNKIFSKKALTKVFVNDPSTGFKNHEKYKKAIIAWLVYFLVSTADFWTYFINDPYCWMKNFIQLTRKKPFYIRIQHNMRYFIINELLLNQRTKIIHQLLFREPHVPEKTQRFIAEHVGVPYWLERTRKYLDQRAACRIEGLYHQVTDRKEHLKKRKEKKAENKQKSLSYLGYILEKVSRRNAKDDLDLLSYFRLYRKSRKKKKFLKQSKSRKKKFKQKKHLQI